MTKLLPAMLIGLLGACGGSPPPEPREYLLRPPALEVVAGARSAVRLRPVEVAPYLDQEGIILEVGEAEVRPAKQHRWAEPLDEAVGRYLQVGIANATGAPVEVMPLTTGGASADVSVRIHQLHGSAEGRVHLVAEWAVTDPSGDRQLHTFDRQIRQSADGYPALVSAHAEVLDALAEAIAATLD